MSSPLARALADAGAEVVRRLVEEHTPGGDGRCRTCRKDGQAPVHPCALADAAAAAQYLLGRRRRRST